MTDIKLKIKNFGPIVDGYDEDGGFMSFPRVTLFCGEQGAGKSTVAKVLSALSWYEKDLFRSNASFGHAKYGFNTLREILHEQSLDDYFNENTEIEYFGNAVHFVLHGVEFVAEWMNDTIHYLKPQIMYMPAERNLAAIIERSGALQLLPRPLRDMLVDFKKASDAMDGVSYRLPTNGYEFRYNKADNKSLIVNASTSDHRAVLLSAASSGLQSMLPMLLVSDFLWRQIVAHTNAEGVLSPENGQSAEKVYAFGEKLKALATQDISDQERLVALNRYLAPNKCFLNIVEEPELNLYPKTQYEVMTRLLKIANSHADNRLVVCTHSPFVVSHMVLKAKEGALLKKLIAMKRDDLLDQLPPEDETLKADEMRLYELRDGMIKRLPQIDGIFSDANMLNAELEGWNAKYDRLLDLEECIDG